MKRTGVLHGELSRIIAELGHGQTIVIADYGLPIPNGIQTVDLAVKPGLPSFLGVLEAVMEELCVESAVVASELPALHKELYEQVEAQVGAVCQTVPHESLKEQLTAAAAIVRTGECTSYANVILRAGVVF